MNTLDPPTDYWTEQPHIERPTDAEADNDSLIETMPEDDVVVQQAQGRAAA